MRLGIPPDRLQVICTSASFKDADYAARFGAQLTGKDARDFVAIRGDLNLRNGAEKGTKRDAEVLAAVDLNSFYEADSDDARLKQVRMFLEYRGVQKPWDLERSLHDALVSFSPMALLINSTMDKAQPVGELGNMLFQGVEPAVSARAVTVLAMGSIAKPHKTQPGMLPCRVHSFIADLPAFGFAWIRSVISWHRLSRGGPTGKLFSQPQDSCECGARVLELFTCRNCGSAYARAYTNDVTEPNFLWAEPGGAFRTLSGSFDELSRLTCYWKIQ